MKKISKQRIPDKKNRKLAAIADLFFTFFYSLIVRTAPVSAKKLREIDYSKVKSILLLRPDGLGDLILTSPLFSALKKIFPNAALTLGVAPWSYQLASFYSEIDSVEVIDFPWVTGNSSAKWIELAKKTLYLRKINFDMVFDLRGDFRLITFQRLLNSKYRLGFDITGCEVALTHLLKSGSSHHPFLMMQDLVVNFDSNIKLNKPSLDLPLYAIDAATALLSQHNINTSEKEKKIAIVHPATRWKGKQWTAKGYREITQKLQQNSFDVIITGAPPEKKFAKQIFDSVAQKPLILSGETDFTTFLGLISLCDLFVGVDSGPAHIASALNRKSVLLFGATFPDMYAPVSSETLIIDHSSQFECSPCSQTVCHRQGNSCMDSISAEEVWEAITKFID